MSHSLRISDFSSPEAKAFWEYAKSLKFVIVEEESEFILSEDQVNAVEEARISYNKKGGKSNDEVLAEMRAKYPNAFKP
jgi:hypothetical protein